MTGHSRVIHGSKSKISFLLRYFEDFYCEVVRFKQAIEAYQLAVEKDPENPPSTPESLIVDNIQEALLKLLNNQAIDTARFSGDYGTQEYREAEFVMVALADEVFVHMDWPGKAAWRDNLLEARLYQTHKAGETLFQQVDKFIRIRDPSRTDMGMVYLLALGLGFQGRYRGMEDQTAITYYKEELFNFIYKRDAILFDSSSLTFKEAYAHTIEEGKPAYFNEFRPWLILFGAACGFMLLISYGIWRFETNELYRNANDIIEMSLSAP